MLLFFFWCGVKKKTEIKKEKWRINPATPNTKLIHKKKQKRVDQFVVVVVYGNGQSKFKVLFFILYFFVLVCHAMNVNFTGKGFERLNGTYVLHSMHNTEPIYRLQGEGFETPRFWGFISNKRIKKDLYLYRDDDEYWSIGHSTNEDEAYSARKNRLYGVQWKDKNGKRISGEIICKGFFQKQNSFRTVHKLSNALTVQFFYPHPSLFKCVYAVLVSLSSSLSSKRFLRRLFCVCFLFYFASLSSSLFHSAL